MDDKTLWWMRDGAKILSQNGTRDHADAVLRGANELERLRRIAELIHNDYRKEAWEEADAYFKELSHSASGESNGKP